MAGSTFGNLFRITTWGESHGPALGVVVDGCPAGLALTEEDIQGYLDRRKPGQSQITTSRSEADRVEILSGVFEGRTTGTPISLLIRNTSQISRDYSDIASCYRPGHADYTFDQKYGFRDSRVGGRSSGRETAGRVAAGVIACKILKKLGIEVCAYTLSIGPITIDPENFDARAICETRTAMPDREADGKAVAYLEDAIKRLDSVGGVMECRVSGVPAGIGDPVFCKLDALLAQAAMSIGAVKAVEIGDGTAVSTRYGSENNDAFRMERDHVVKATNHAGGILGGISDGSDILLRAHVKPTPSIYAPQQTVDNSGHDIDIQIKGRHDPIIVPRAVVVLECMTAITLLDAMMANLCCRMDSLERFYRNSDSSQD